MCVSMKSPSAQPGIGATYEEDDMKVGVGILRQTTPSILAISP